MSIHKLKIMDFSEFGRHTDCCIEYVDDNFLDLRQLLGVVVLVVCSILVVLGYQQECSDSQQVSQHLNQKLVETSRGVFRKR